ncbi:MAG TPA: helix-turn-helix transcriptional regulator, partial [Firmicutes bacterium]|nr:helix-turn-helix transcriptional regulator [Bacillota bacterium]
MSLMVTMFAKRLRELREKHGWSQQQLADRIGTARVTITMYEAGEREPDFDT